MRASFFLLLLTGTLAQAGFFENLRDQGSLPPLKENIVDMVLGKNKKVNVLIYAPLTANTQEVSLTTSKLTEQGMYAHEHFNNLAIPGARSIAEVLKGFQFYTDKQFPHLLGHFRPSPFNFTLKPYVPGQRLTQLGNANLTIAIPPSNATKEELTSFLDSIAENSSLGTMVIPDLDLTPHWLSYGAPDFIKYQQRNLVFVGAPVGNFFNFPLAGRSNLEMGGELASLMAFHYLSEEKNLKEIYKQAQTFVTHSHLNGSFCMAPPLQEPSHEDCTPYDFTSAEYVNLHNLYTNYEADDPTIQALFSILREFNRTFSERYVQKICNPQETFGFKFISLKEIKENSRVADRERIAREFLSQMNTAKIMYPTLGSILTPFINSMDKKMAPNRIQSEGLYSTENNPVWTDFFHEIDDLMLQVVHRTVKTLKNKLEEQITVLREASGLSVPAQKESEEKSFTERFLKWGSKPSSQALSTQVEIPPSSKATEDKLYFQRVLETLTAVSSGPFKLPNLEDLCEPEILQELHVKTKEPEETYLTEKSPLLPKDKSPSLIPTGRNSSGSKGEATGTVEKQVPALVLPASARRSSGEGQHPAHKGHKAKHDEGVQHQTKIVSRPKDQTTLQ